MKRHVSNLAFVFSLVAGALVLLLWVRSHWLADEVEWVRLRRGEGWAVWHESFVRSEGGGLRVDYQPGREEGEYLYFTDEGRFKPKLAWSLEAAADDPYRSRESSPPNFRMYGLAWGSESNGNAGSRDTERWRWTSGEYFLVLPYWFLFLLAFILPAHRLVQTWRRRRRGGRGFEVSVA